MLLIRRFEEKAGQLYGMGLIQGFCHLYIGQEAVVIGMQAAAQSQDSIITSYRDHGHMLATGMDPKGVMAELTGQRVGYSKGKGGSMHMFSREKTFGGHGIVGAQVPIGTGLGFAHKYKEDQGVCMTYYGDGAANQGQVYRSFNMAALWKLLLFISSKIIVMAWEHRCLGLLPTRNSLQEAKVSAFLGIGLMAWMSRLGKGSRSKSIRILPLRQKTPYILACKPIGTGDIPCRIQRNIGHARKLARSAWNRSNRSRPPNADR